MVVSVGVGRRQRVDGGFEDGGGFGVEARAEADHAGGGGLGEPQAAGIASFAVEPVLVVVAGWADLFGVMAGEPGQLLGGSRSAWSVRSVRAVARSPGSATGWLRVSKSMIWAALPTVTCWVATSSRSRAQGASVRAVPTVMKALACAAVRDGSWWRSQSVRESPSGASRPRAASSEMMVTRVTSWVRRWAAARSAAVVRSAAP
ncbi:hypothetical protein GCM10009817_28360 [Terrabacter lapilli]|uniref:Uncharacterized protein n=1 Tax=Terrabacter lapilli TaxID=436231 RepID=A0ABN2SE92_9MICO